MTFNRSAFMSDRNLKHGHAARGRVTPTYKVWLGMLYRVGKDPDYLHVSISPEWESYEVFLRDMGEKPKGMTIDRVDPKLGYCAENCRWATQLQQQNNRTNNVRIEFLGRSQTISEWARELGLNYKTLHNRIYACKWGVERALTEPVRDWGQPR